MVQTCSVRARFHFSLYPVRSGVSNCDGFAFCGCDGNSAKSKDVCNDTACLTNKNSMHPSLSCKLTTAELRERKATVIAELKSKSIDKIELSNGFSYKFDNSDSTIDMLSEFIKTERQCCDFCDFSIRLTGGFTWLDITGPEGAKAFIKSELEL